jgi:hypothetical protein
VFPPHKILEDSVIFLCASDDYTLSFDRDFVYAVRDGKNCRYPLHQVKRIA